MAALRMASLLSIPWWATETNWPRLERMVAGLQQCVHQILTNRVKTWQASSESPLKRPNNSTHGQLTQVFSVSKETTH